MNRLILLVAAFAGLQGAGRPVAAHTAAAASPAKAPATCGPDALGTSRTLVVGTQGGPRIGLESYPQTLPLADHEVVLTFDDGPGATTPAVLDALAHECVAATFFLIGRNAAAEPELVRREIAAGHTVGHHTFSHPARTLRRMTTSAAEADIDRGFAADDLAGYGASGAAPRVPFFRFPGFADTPDLDAWLGTRDIAIFGTDIWAYDWLDETPERELDLLMTRLDRLKKGVILLHDTRTSTARMVPALLRALKAGGYRIVRIVPGPGKAETTPAPPGWSSVTERVIAEVFAREASHHARPARGWIPGAHGAPWHRRFAIYGVGQKHHGAGRRGLRVRRRVHR